MEKHILKIKNSFVILIMIMWPSVLILANGCSPTLGDGSPNPNYPACGSTGSTSSTGGSNPISEVLFKAVDFLTGVVAAFGVVLLVIAGFYFVTARGDRVKIERARAIVLWVLLGMAVVMLSQFFIGTLAIDIYNMFN